MLCRYCVESDLLKIVLHGCFLDKKPCYVHQVCPLKMRLHKSFPNVPSNLKKVKELGLDPFSNFCLIFRGI